MITSTNSLDREIQGMGLAGAELGYPKSMTADVIRIAIQRVTESGASTMKEYFAMQAREIIAYDVQRYGPIHARYSSSTKNVWGSIF